MLRRRECELWVGWIACCAARERIGYAAPMRVMGTFQKIVKCAD